MPRTTTPLDHAEFTPQLAVERSGYILRFAHTAADLDEVCELRYEVFNVELGEGFSESELTQRDRDEFDEQCQHLMVIEARSGQAVGTYRLQVPEVARAHAGLYSASEFDLAAMPTGVLDESVELGRACVARAHRSRRVLFLLWQGLLSYIEFNRKRYFFGCSSLTSQSPAEGLRLLQQLEADGYMHPSITIPPKPDFECVADGPLPEQEVAIPQLFGMYLRYGAKILGPPAIDRVFGTIDYLTLLDVRGVPDNVIKNFRV